MEVLLIRHGKSTRAGGGQADTALSDKGRKQARATGRALVGSGVSTLYTSPLQRASKTAESIGQELGIQPIVLDDLAERSGGIFDGLAPVDIEARYADEYAAWLASPLDAPPEGESYTEMRKRAKRVIDTITAAHAATDDTIALVAHGAILNALLNLWLRLPRTQYPLFKLSNASVSSLTVAGDRAVKVNYLNRLQ